MPEGGAELSPPPNGFEELGAKKGFPAVELSGDVPIAKGAVLLGPRRSRRSKLLAAESAAFFFFPFFRSFFSGLASCSGSGS